MLDKINQPDHRPHFSHTNKVTLESVICVRDLIKSDVQWFTRCHFNELLNLSFRGMD